MNNYFKSYSQASCGNSNSPTAQIKESVTFCTNVASSSELIAVSFMKIKVLLTILLTACSGQVISQNNDSIKLDINHIFFCIDSITYDNLFKNEFIGKTFANASESSNKTLTDSWTGKYIMGRQSYVEVFPSNFYKGNNPQLGDKFGDVGIVFKTKRQGDINKIDSLIKIDKRDTHFKLNEYESDGKIIPFTYNLYLSDADLEETFRPYVDERTTNFLKLYGFSETEINSGITEEQFREKRRGKKFEKLYDDIEKIELILTDKEFEYLATSLKYFGFSQTGHRFTNNKLKIICSVRQNRSYKLKAIYFKLHNNTEDIKIEISKNLTFIAKGTKAVFQFNY